jgi:hypothetical protein
VLTPTFREKPLPKRQDALRAVEESASENLDESEPSADPSGSQRQPTGLDEEPQFVTLEEFN